MGAEKKTSYDLSNTQRFCNTMCAKGIPHKLSDPDYTEGKDGTPFTIYISTNLGLDALY